ncbi:hypothetical protein HW132_01660 [Brasilonema sp. CT11]|nr:hypothetical protein [Brasilonema sp. CT11]
MIIADLSHLEITTDNHQIQGGAAFSDAYALAYANGQNFAATSTSTYTNASSGYYYYPYGYYYSPNSANSNSSSKSTAA